MAEGAGRIYFVGAGPGDPGLLTLRGAEVLARCEVVVHDADVHGDTLARAGANAERVAADADASITSARSIARARSGEIVGRVLAGDPTLGGDGVAEIAAAHAAGVAFEIVPGVPSVAAAGAYAGVGLGGGEIAIAGARAVPVELGEGDALGAAARALIASGLPATTPAALISDLSRTSQAVASGTLEALASGAVVDPNRRSRSRLLVVGDAARPDRRERLSWFEGRPLSGKRILVTRARDQAATTAALLRERGADPVVHPTIELHPPADEGPMHAAVARLGEYAYVAFTSANGVERTWGALRSQGLDARAFGKARIAAVGPGTAQALAAHGLQTDVVARELVGEGLAEAILEAMAGGARGATVLLLRAQVARDVLPDALRAAGCIVDVVSAYETHPAPPAVAGAIAAELERGGLDAVTFTSSSTVDNLCDLLGAPAASLLRRTCVASIGPITSATAARRGLRVDVTARAYTVRGLVDALEAHFADAAGAAR